jgi:hypothetical protein
LKDEINETNQKINLEKNNTNKFVSEEELINSTEDLDILKNELN